MNSRMRTYDVQTIDSTGAFLVGELERLDLTLHEPLVNFTWTRDIDLREDVSIADESSSFINSSFAAAGGFNSNGINFIGKNTNMIGGLALDIGKTVNPLYLWGMELSYTIPELLSAQQIGRPVDEQKLAGIKLKWNMDVDQMAYIGSTEVGKYGLCNSDQVSAGFVATNGGSPALTQWIYKTAVQILYDINDLLETTWAASGYAVCPSKLLLPPAQFAYITSQKVSSAGNISILKFVEDNCIALTINGKKLEIKPVKWLAGLGTAAGSPLVATDRMVAYSQEKNRVRYPLVPMQRTPLEYRSLFHLTTYFCRLGVVEVVYGETLGYADGL